MQQLTLSRPLSWTRVLTLPDRPRTPSKASINLQAAAGLKAPATLKAAPKLKTSAGTASRKRLTLPLRPIRSLPPRPSLANLSGVQPAPRGRELPCGAVAFASAAQAWFWTLGALAARHDGIRLSSVGRGNTGGSRVAVQRPCDPDDVIRALDLLHQRGDITLAHARVLRRWGDRGIAPNAIHPGQEADAVLWSEATERLEILLCAKRIVAVIE